MFKSLSIIFLIILTGWFFFFAPSKEQWVGQAAVSNPEQSLDNLPSSWGYQDFVIIPKANYHIKAIVLSKHSYWAGEMEDRLAKFDLALGWGAMSDVSIINQLDISQGGRWYEYRWKNSPPIEPGIISSHSANNHIVPADRDVLEKIKKIKKNDLVELEGYLVDIQNTKINWSWHSSLSRTDTARGSCELFWVTKASVLYQ